MTAGEKRTPCAEEIDAAGCFGKADRKLAAGNFNSAMGLFRMGVRKLEAVAGRNAEALVRFDIAETIASIGNMLVSRKENIRASREFFAAAVIVMKGIVLDELPTEAQMAVGTWHLQLGYLNNGPAAEQSARSSITILEKLANHPGAAQARTHLANAIVALARSLVSQRRGGDATEALNRVPALVKESPEDIRQGILTDRQTILEIIGLLP